MPAEVIVGIDFGTTYSGFAHAKAGSDNDVTLFTNWPARPNGVPTAKTRTVALYENSSLVDIGFSADCEFTRLLKTAPSPSSSTTSHIHLNGIDYHLVARVKLLLIKELLPSLPPLPPNTTAVDIIAAYLRQMNEMINKELPAFYGTVRNDQITYCLTVPAMWTDSAKNAMREAALLAGLIDDFSSDRLKMISEPEAGVHYALKQSGPNNHFEILPGDHFMVVDAGGGTVDLTVHSMNDDRTLNEEDIAGRFCGSSRVDDAFFSLLRHKLGDEAIHTIEANGISITDSFMNEWLSRKHLFTGDSDPLPLEIPLSVFRALGNNPEVPYTIPLTKEEMSSLFDGPVQASFDLIDDLLSKHPAITKMILIGGFCTSEYLRAKMRERYGTRFQLIIVNDSQAAVVKGAVMAVSNPTLVGERIARSTYGIRFTHRSTHTITKTSFFCFPKTKKIPRVETDRFKPILVSGQRIHPGDEFIADNFKAPVADRMVIPIYIATNPATKHCSEKGCKEVGNLSIVVKDGSDFAPGTPLVIRMGYELSELRMTVVNKKNGAEASTRVQLEDE